MEEKKDSVETLGEKAFGFLKRAKSKVKDAITEEGGIDAAADKLRKKASQTLVQAASTATKVAANRTVKAAGRIALDKATGVAGQVAELTAKGLKNASEGIDLGDVPEGGAQTGARVGALVGKWAERGYRLFAEAVNGTVSRVQAEAKDATLQQRHPELIGIGEIYAEFASAKELEVNLEREGIKYIITKKAEDITGTQLKKKGLLGKERVPVMVGKRSLTTIVAETPVGDSTAVFAYDEPLSEDEAVSLIGDYQKLVETVFAYCEAGLKEDIKSFKRKDLLDTASAPYEVNLSKDENKFTVSFRPVQEGKKYSLSLGFRLNLPKNITQEAETTEE